MTPRTMRAIGGALIAYGLAGVVLLVVLAAAMGRPIDEIERLAGSLGEQRAAALAALDDASATVGQTAQSVRSMESSLVQARLATERAAGLSRGVSQNMRDLGAAMGVRIFNVQPLIGLAAGFEQSALNLDLLADDVAAIGRALDANTGDAAAVAGGLDDLRASLERLRTSVAASPELTESATSLEPLRLGMLALIVWLLLGAVGCIVAGLGCWWAAARAVVIDLHD